MDFPSPAAIPDDRTLKGASMAPLVAVADDDVSVRESLESLIRPVGLEVRLCRRPRRNAYLTKPFGDDEFLDAVEAALNWRRPSIHDRDPTGEGHE
jgi:FixJ family two-component response regulator